MAHERIIRLRIAPGPGWSQPCESLARRVVNARCDVAVRVVRIDDEHAVLVASADDRSVLDRIGRTVIDPWMEEIAVVEPPSSATGETAWSFAPVDRWAEIDVLDDVGRCEHFVRRAVESGAVWGLHDKTWARSNAAPGREALPLWPDRELAVRCIAGPWRTFRARAIELHLLREEWLTGMREDGIVAVITPTPTDPGVVVEPDVLAEALTLATD